MHGCCQSRGVQSEGLNCEIVGSCGLRNEGHAGRTKEKTRNDGDLHEMSESIFPADIELLHAGFQGRGFESQESGSTALPAHAPSGGAQHA